jgi:hypothetical protein
MTESIDQAFVKTFESEVHSAYQRMGSKLKSTVRCKHQVQGASTVFQKVGKGQASTKKRHGLISPMNLNHATVECFLEDYYAGDWVDALDELKINWDERQILAQAGAYALGRQTDQLIINALNTLKQTPVLDAKSGLTKDKILSAKEQLGLQDIPDDGQIFAVIGWRQMSELLKIPEFANSDYVGSDALPWKGGGRAKEWMGTIWIPHSGLPIENDIRKCFWYHKTAIGHACGSDIRTMITYSGEHASYFVNSMMSQGSCVIDEGGVLCMPCHEPNY